MKHLPVGRQNFAEIINEQLLYVDKTQQIHELIMQGKLYFLSRPRRFGKSLLVSTLNYLFKGEKALFEELYIGKFTDYAFKPYPVLQFNFADFGLKNTKLENELTTQIHAFAEDFGVTIVSNSISTQLKTLIQEIAKRYGQVVVLIDEYDKPIIDFLTDSEQAQQNQEILRSFFSPLKGLEAQGHLRFLFITGISKFSKVSLFSDLNNLTDLTVHPLSMDLLGITHKELLDYFEPYIEQVLPNYQLTKTEMIEEITRWYNGYSYDGKTFVHNPFSLLSFFDAKQFKNFWFATGTPTFLVQTVRDEGIHPKEFEQKLVDDTFFDKFSIEQPDMAALLFQTGYLTIKNIQYRRTIARYELSYPNQEVRQSMIHNLVEAFSYKSNSVISKVLFNLQDALEQANLAVFVQQLTIIFSDLKYNWQPPKPYRTQDELFNMWEGYFHAIIYLVMSSLELEVQAEVAHYKGRLDLVTQTKDYLYIMEFKLDGDLGKAMEQIKNRAYPNAYAATDKTIYLVAINFSQQERNIEDWCAEVWDKK